jgi:hypothetical protein
MLAMFKAVATTMEFVQGYFDGLVPLKPVVAVGGHTTQSGVHEARHKDEV